jgi:hypothetical protein
MTQIPTVARTTAIFFISTSSFVKAYHNRRIRQGNGQWPEALCAALLAARASFISC